jgi:hypothetical protein
LIAIYFLRFEAVALTYFLPSFALLIEEKSRPSSSGPTEDI